MAHLLGEIAPEVTIHCITQDDNTWTHTGRFRLGTYSPDLENNSIYGNVDCDGGSHTSSLEHPLGVALEILSRLTQLGLTGYLEKSGSGTGWHP
jgi:hypothetical protein